MTSPERAPQETHEERSEACYELYCNLTGDQTSPSWRNLTIAQREAWRRVVDRARRVFA